MKIRIGLGSCGIAAGASKVKESVEAEIQKRGLDIEVKDTGCIGMCHAEPC
ncbi:MAG: (2Fe-2S) ferredoxin domain-containing protein [Thermoanaerobacterales bacterium]|nr:(2Fe-2S) ferredoxin domain-containing protein [Thermoanaerobacterales bacterium]